ncbi:hypothetical protein QBC47DRAFT_45855 [Echria macrotheca]|uniref:Uncharacterized protein n=1 Tax=Echria macrotheca TaxID=438768 RepID=A0AAJ0BCY0_9PEZI|nr:hypothetical protein QBC47DRAFT_45855 [Echria macrotheca]
MVAVLRKIRRSLSAQPTPKTAISERLGSPEKQPEPEPEPGFLERSSATGRCRLPTLESITQACDKTKLTQDQIYKDVDPRTTQQMTADLTRPFGQSTGRGFSFTRFRAVSHKNLKGITYRDGLSIQLYMRQQDVWEPQMGPDGIPTLQTLYEIGHILVHADPICQHLRWDAQYPLLVQDMSKFRLDQYFGNSKDERSAYYLLPRDTLNGEVDSLLPYREKVSKVLQCVLLHPVGCVCGESIELNVINTCEECYTDYAVRVLPGSVPGHPERRFLVFTTWKCLGNGSPASKEWRSHQTLMSSRHNALRRLSDYASVQQAFEAPALKNRWEIFDAARTQKDVSLARERRSQREALPAYSDVA